MKSHLQKNMKTVKKGRSSIKRQQESMTILVYGFQRKPGAEWPQLQ